jgi:hypothetical protein
MYILIIWAASSILFFSIVIGTEYLIIPRLNPSSKFRVWWRNNIIGYYEE